LVNLDYFITLILIFIRLSSFFIICKAFYPKGTPGALKLFFGLIFSFTLIPGVKGVSLDLISNNYTLIVYFLSEISTGVILGLITNIMFDTVSLAGSWIDAHIGLSMISMLDPNSEAQVTITAKILNYVAMAIFFTVDGHHLLLKSLVESYTLVPLGKSIINEGSITYFMEVITNYFFIGLKIAIPMVLIIILTDICMGLISRVVPQINVMILGMPVKMIVGIVTVAVALPLIIKIFVSTLSYIPDVFRKIFYTIPIAFVFADDKTEEATPKKKQDARKKGQVAKSKDVGLAFTMIACTVIIVALSGFLVSNARENIIYYLGNSGTMEITEITLKNINSNVISRFLLAVLPFITPIMVFGIIASLAQTGFMLTGEPLKPSFKKLNPINGFKNMFSKKNAADLVKNLLVVIIVSWVGITYFKNNYSKIIQISNLYTPEIGTVVKELVVGIFVKISIVLVILAAIDYLLQFKFYNDELKMSKQDIKEEYKQMEGDPQIKSKIKQKQREMSQRRMMQAVGDATVVITNPTHIAVAIKYEEGKMEAPKLVAKGAENIAIKIKELAKEANVPIVENKPLARMIYSKVELDEDIPQDMYQAVAEVLVVILKMKNKKR
jgi:flagellar biosynthetic protein FliR/FlhB